MAKKSKNFFPKDFLWGASTSAHQVEGGNYNQWTLWEQANAEKLAKSAHKRMNWLPVWDEIKHQAEKPGNYLSGDGIDHYNRYTEDFDLLEKLNLNSFRFSIEWSRIEPEEGVWNWEEIEHYKTYIKELNKRSIEPVLNIWHWTMPIWFTDKGAFKKRSNLKYWKRFVHLVATELLDGVNYVITLNEPNVYTSFGYLTKDTSSGAGWPPGENSFISFFRVYRNLAKAHREAYYILKIQKHSLQVGVASQLANIQAKRPHNYLDEFVTELMRYFWNWWFLRRSRKEQDFIGLNYYFSDYYQFPFLRENPKVPLNDMGWYMEPEGIYPLILRVWAHYKKPVIITENGVADMHDQFREWWLQETIIAMQRAISEGVPIKGYFHWSLLDNFEWTSGWNPKFGLVEVDRQKGMKRTIRPSAKWFATRIKDLSK
jgi:beta-glucosidase